MTFTNEQKAKIFHDWLGGRFKTFEVASPDTAPISFVAKDNEDKEYYVFVNVAKELSINDNRRYETGIIIENTHFYHLYAMMSQGQNVFWFEAFNDGYIIFYLNDCLTPEQLKVTEEVTLIGVTSALHVQRPEIRHESSDGKSYVKLASTTNEPTIIKGSMELELPKAKINKRKK